MKYYVPLLSVRRNTQKTPKRHQNTPKDALVLEQTPEMCKKETTTSRKAEINNGNANLSKKCYILSFYNVIKVKQKTPKDSTKRHQKTE